MSAVSWWPPTASTRVCTIAPSVKIAKSVVPPPMSMSATPSSFSSSCSTASAEASGSSTTSCTCRPQRRRHQVHLGLEAHARHPERLLDAVLVVDRVLLRQDVDDLAVLRNVDR